MRLTKIAAIIAAVLLAVPAFGQNIATVPTAASLGGGERIIAAQGSGCVTNVSPCLAVAVTPALLATYLAQTFQPLDTDLSAIAALTTTPFGRAILAQADAPTIRSYLGLGTNATDSTPRVPTSLTIGTAAPLTGGGALTGNLSLGITAATGSAAGTMSAADKAKLDGIAAGATANTGTVTSVAATGANGVTASVTNSTTTPSVTVGLGAITPASVAATGAISGTTGTFSGALSASNFTGSSSGTNTGDNANTTGNAGTATKWATARTVALTGIVTGTVSIDGSANASMATAFDNTAWTTFPLNIFSSTGTLTTATAGGRYKQVGKTLFVKIWVNITTNGTGAAYLYITGYPFSVFGSSMTDYQMIPGRAYSAANQMVSCVFQGGTAYMQSADGSYPGGSNVVLIFDGTIEST